MKDDQPELHPRCKLEEEVEEVSSQDPGWELSSDSTASPVGQSELSLPAHITESKTGFSFSTTASWLLTSQNNTTSTLADDEFQHSAFPGIKRVCCNKTILFRRIALIIELQFTERINKTAAVLLHLQSLHTREILNYTWMYVS